MSEPHAALPERVVRFVRERLGGEPAECFHFEQSVGAVYGVRLEDGRRVALKAHLRGERDERLDSLHRVQLHLREHGFPCPRPLAPPLDGVTGAEWVDEGEPVTGREPAVRRLLARALARQIELALPLASLPALEWMVPGERLWPTPHSPLFDFERTAAGAEWIDRVAARAAEPAQHGPLVLAHTDWSAKHFRVRDGRITVVYDWDSLALQPEPRAVGFAAATHTARLDLPEPWRPRVDETEAFLADYPRPLDLGAARAAAVYVVAYTARCEHALAATGESRFVTQARAALPEFARELLP